MQYMLNVIGPCDLAAPPTIQVPSHVRNFHGLDENTCQKVYVSVRHIANREV
jgi:hypothetical protein